MGKTGLTPLFSKRKIIAKTGAFVVTQNLRILRILQFVGETFVNEARNNRTYQDQTGNLRASIGYVIANNGQIIKSDYAKGAAGTQNEALNAAKKAARTLTALDKQNGYALIVFAGMEYASSVESKGFDVISGSIPGAEQLLKSLSKLLII